MCFCRCVLLQPTEYFDMGIFLAFFVVVSLVCLILLIKIKLKQRRSQVRLHSAVCGLNVHLIASCNVIHLFHVRVQFKEVCCMPDMPCFPSISSTIRNCFPTCQSSMNRMAIQALEKMETRKFKAKVKGQREASCGASDSVSSSSTPDCAICLEKYIDGEVKIFF